MMKILFFIESLEVGGAEKSLVTLLNSDPFENHSIDLMMLKGGTFLQDVPAHVNIIFVEDLQTSLFKRFYYFITKIIKKNNLHDAQYFWGIFKNDYRRVDQKYDVAIAYSQGFSTYFVAEKVSATRKYTWLNTDYQKTGYVIASDYPFYKSFTKIITVSVPAFESFNLALQSINASLPVEIIRDIIDKNWIECQATQPLKTIFKSNNINIVSVGRLVSVKGFNLAISACAILKSKGYYINWYIVGEGTERKNLEKQILQEKLQDSFFLLGSDGNPYTYMKVCDIYVQTSLLEGLGITLIEASYLNKPIVCTNFRTAYDILMDEETGLIAEMNGKSIAMQIERLIQSPELKKRLISNSKKRYNNHKEITLNQIKKLLSIS